MPGNTKRCEEIRALGTLGSWTAAFGKGGSFTIQGDTGSFLGAANDGNVICAKEVLVIMQVSVCKTVKYRY